MWKRHIPDIRKQLWVEREPVRVQMTWNSLLYYTCNSGKKAGGEETGGDKKQRLHTNKASGRPGQSHRREEGKKGGDEGKREHPSPMAHRDEIPHSGYSLTSMNGG